MVALCVFVYAENKNSASLRFLPGRRTNITAEPRVPWLVSRQVPSGLVRPDVGC